MDHVATTIADWTPVAAFGVLCFCFCCWWYLLVRPDRTERRRQLATLPSVTPNAWKSLTMTLRLSTFHPQGEWQRCSHGQGGAERVPFLRQRATYLERPGVSTVFVTFTNTPPPVVFVPSFWPRPLENVFSTQYYHRILDILNEKVF